MYFTFKCDELIEIQSMKMEINCFNQIKLGLKEIQTTAFESMEENDRNKNKKYELDLIKCWLD